MHMKTKNIIARSLMILVTGAVLSSCSDLFKATDIKQNPNNPLPSQVDITPLTTGSLVGIGTLHEDTDVRIAYMWSGQLLGQSRQHQGFWNYTVAASTFDWGNYYNTGQNIRLVQQRAAAVNNKLHLGVAQVMEALLFTKLTSLWGDVPYSEAFDIVNHPTPKYDGQIAIYNALIALLNTAYTNLNSGLGSITGDFIYPKPNGLGDPIKWAAAAKTLQARLYLHLKDYTNAAAAAALGIKSTSNDMLMPHGSAYQIDLNLNFDFFDIDRPGDCSFDDPAYLPIFMTTDLASGIRTEDVAQRNAKTDETGIYWHFFTYGWETNGRDPNVVDGMFVDVAPQPWLTFYENHLILAEATARLASGTGADQTAIDVLNSVRAGLLKGYINGQTSGYVSEGLVYDDYVPADFDQGGIANPGTKFANGKTALLTEIASEKFITLISQYESFNELRRLQVTPAPVVSLGIPINNGSKYPARFIYPQNEINTNPNVPMVSGSVPNQFDPLPVFK
jgi:hypothetical protein